MVIVIVLGREHAVAVVTIQHEMEVLERNGLVAVFSAEQTVFCDDCDEGKIIRIHHSPP